MASKICIYYREKLCHNTFACSKKLGKGFPVKCSTKGVLEWDALKKKEEGQK